MKLTFKVIECNKLEERIGWKDSENVSDREINKRTSEPVMGIGGIMLDLGHLGESEACRYLARHGYEILERNFRCRAGEVDIVARTGNKLCFVEVKTRKSAACGWPGEAVDAKKRRHMKKAAQYYLLSHSAAGMELRVDVIEILIRGEKTYLRHIKNIFLE